MYKPRSKSLVPYEPDPVRIWHNISNHWFIRNSPRRDKHNPDERWGGEILSVGDALSDIAAMLADIVFFSLFRLVRVRNVLRKVFSLRESWGLVCITEKYFSAHSKEHMEKQASELTGQVAVVTGGSRGIGEAISRNLASIGVEVLVNYMARKDAADKVVASILDNGGKAKAFQFTADFNVPARNADNKDSGCLRQWGGCIMDCLKPKL